MGKGAGRAFGIAKQAVQRRGRRNRCFGIGTLAAMNGKLLIIGAVCLAIFVVPATLMYGRDPNSVWFLVPLVPVALVGASLVLLAAIRALFGAFGFSGAIASLSAGLIAIVQYFIGSRMGMQGMSAFWSAVFAWCGGGLAVISGVMWLRLQGGGDRDR